MNEEVEPDTGRTRTIIAAVSLVLLAVVIMIGYGYYKNSQRSSQTPTATPSADQSATPAAGSDVSVETVNRTSAADPADANLLTYTVRFRVKSDAKQDEVIIEEELEAGQEYVEDSATPHVATYDSSTRRLQWHLKGVPAGYEGNLTYQVTKE